MSKVKKRGEDPSTWVTPTNEDELKRFYLAYWYSRYDMGQSARLICVLLEEVAKSRGYEIDFSELRAPLKSGS